MTDATPAPAPADEHRRPPSYLLPASCLLAATLGLVVAGTAMGVARTAAWLVALPASVASVVLAVAVRRTWAAGDEARSRSWSRAAGACSLLAFVAVPVAVAVELASRVTR